ncbi:MAG: hypothetical protein GY856_23520, partial [bacterium]|nr:hypothetical protein [bacterium]
MRFKLDENLPLELLAELRKAGHAADSVPDEGLIGAPDPEIIRKTKDASQVLLTMDK